MYFTFRAKSQIRIKSNLRRRNMNKKRSNELSSHHHDHTQRTSRGYQVNGQWYFELRGGGQKGPYDNELEMRADLNEFIFLHEKMHQ